MMKNSSCHTSRVNQDASLFPRKFHEVIDDSARTSKGKLVLWVVPSTMTLANHDSGKP